MKKVKIFPVTMAIEKIAAYFVFPILNCQLGQFCTTINLFLSLTNKYIA